MTIRAVAMALAVGLVLSIACGGDADPGAGTGQRVTDPAKVPTSTPLQNGVLYQLRGSQIITQGGSTAVPGASQPAGPRTYTVLEGDTCSGIASKLNVSLQDLLTANRSINQGCTNLRVGDVLRLPSGAVGGATPVGATSTPRPGSTREYTVKSGDTCSGIAGSYSVALADLVRINGLDPECRTLQVGQVLKIP